MTSNNAQSQDEVEDGGPASETGPTETPRGRLTRLTINRFRQVKPGTELRFDDGINVLLGRNGTGKTTLLELICAVASGDLRAYEHESFELEFELVLNGEVLLVSARNETAHQRISIDVNEPSKAAWAYHIHYSARDGSVYQIEAVNGRTQLVGGDLALPEASLFAPGFHEICICLALDIKSTNFLGFRDQSLRFTKGLFRMDEGLDVFRSITDGLPLPRTRSPLLATLFSGSPWGNPRESVVSLMELMVTYIPGSLLELLLEQGESVHSATQIGISSSEWPLLETIRTLINVKRLQVTLQLVERKEAEGVTQLSTFGRPVFRATTHSGTTFTHDKLSYGEKRLLAFMYHAAANPQILVADELVNGLHHEWIQACLDAIQGQAFLTSQNPLLLDHLPFSSGEEVQRRFVLCDRDEQGRWIWRNMDPAAAAAFYRAYEVGIQHVSEILETKGLW